MKGTQKFNGARPDGAIRIPRPRGRPRELSQTERRRRLVDAAERVFLDQGYGATSMDDIADRASMSKKTLYQVFATKEALFTAVMSDRLASLITAFESEQERKPSRRVLEDYLMQVALLVLSPGVIGMHRVLIAEAWRTPELAQTFHRECPGRGKAILVRWLAKLCAEEGLTLEDPEEAAGMLFGMAIGELHMKLLMGAMRPPSKAAIVRRVRRALDIFLKGAAAR